MTIAFLTVTRYTRPIRLLHIIINKLEEKYRRHNNIHFIIVIKTYYKLKS